MQTPSEEAAAHLFEHHGQDIVQRARDVGAWVLARSPSGTPRLQRVILDKHRRVVSVFIEPVPHYPSVPPRVVTKPRVEDLCFNHDGELCWASVGERLVWTEYAGGENPLLLLLDELRRKYHIL